MKRWFLLISMIVCLCVSAVCPGVQAEASSMVAAVYTEDQYLSAAESYFQSLISMDAATVDAYLASGSLDEVTTHTLQSLQALRQEAGEYIETLDKKVSIEEDAVTVTLTVQFAEREGIFTLVVTPDMQTLTSASFEQKLTTGEIFQKAALNTLMGMGTVFIVLILIAFIISLFKYIPRIQEMAAKRRTPAVIEEKTMTPVLEEEELVDDKELVAVIMAAIYASMEEQGKAVSKDRLVVRSIRRSRR